jgi:hypothetical protein
LLHGFRCLVHSTLQRARQRLDTTSPFFAAGLPLLCSTTLQRARQRLDTHVALLCCMASAAALNDGVVASVGTELKAAHGIA